MNRRTRITLIIVAIAVAAAAIGIATLGDGSSVPTLTIEPTTFQRRVTAEGTLDAVDSTPVSAPREMRQPMKIGWIAEDQTWVKEGDPIVRFDPTEFQDALRSGQKDRSVAGNRALKADTEAQTTLRNLKRDERMAQREYEVADTFDYQDVAEVFSRYEVIESGIDKDLAAGRRDHAGRMQEIRGDISEAERRLIEIEQRKADFSIQRAQSGLSALEVNAPHDGILVLQRDWRGELPRVGGNVFPGMALAQLPKRGAMKAEVYILEADFGGITEGQPAKVRIESEPGRTWNARVSRVDKVAKPRFRGVPVQFFGVTLSLDETDPALMKPGARVRATIELANEENAIVIPRQAIHMRENKRIVWKREGDAFIPVEIETGAGSVGRVVVTKGLAAGDVIALDDPERIGRDGGEES